MYIIAQFAGGLVEVPPDDPDRPIIETTETTGSQDGTTGSENEAEVTESNTQNMDGDTITTEPADPSGGENSCGRTSNHEFRRRRRAGQHGVELIQTWERRTTSHWYPRWDSNPRYRRERAAS